MRRVLYILLAAVALPTLAAAQVSKQVEVSKDYTPSVSAAQKMAIVPDMTDTVKMRPDIDYSIEPRTFQTSLLTENFKPATITYWDFYRARPLYVRLASGAPLASEADVYVSAFNKDRGYAMAYINHWGDYRNRINMAGEKITDKTTEMSNRVGGRAGLFVGRHTLEVDLGADQQIRHRYPSTGAAIRFGKVAGRLRFGDDFVDLSRWNFNLEVGGEYFLDGLNVSDFNESALSAKVALGKMVGGKHLLRLHAEYDGDFGYKALKNYRNNTFMAGARYGFNSERFEFLIGADYYYDDVASVTSSPHHIFPYLRMTWKRPTTGFVPYVEVDGGLRENDFATLIYRNPFLRASGAVAEALPKLANESVYNGRVGFGGVLGGIFSYNLSAELSLADNHAYWYNYGAEYYFAEAYQHSLHIDLSAKLRPIGWFEAELTAGAYAWENYDDYYSSRPSFETELALRFTGRKLRAGVNVGYRGAINWMTLTDVDGGSQPVMQKVKTDGTFLVGAEVEWRINDRWGVYAEGRNLAGSNIYEWLCYYTDSPQGLLGVKFSF
ncbi:MAG: hypothetical protein J6J91_04470 [Alistipes sp.]|nr:hypothetical protein [Alistipes sp.]